jgi:hypothetical protein
MRVNWTPFFTLFPLRLPANDIVDENSTGDSLVGKGRNELSQSFFKFRRESCHTTSHSRDNIYYAGVVDRTVSFSGSDAGLSAFTGGPPVFFKGATTHAHIPATTRVPADGDAS